MQNSVVCTPKNPPKCFTMNPVRVVASASSQTSHPAHGQESSFSLGWCLLGKRWPFTGPTGAACHIFCLSGMQEQYELVYDAVIELFKRQIEALDAQKDSAASQVKLPGQTSCLLQPGHSSPNLNSCCRPGMNPRIFCSP